LDNTNKLELKVQALLERVSTLTADYENKVADLRVELTALAAENASLMQMLEESNRENSEESDDEQN